MGHKDKLNNKGDKNKDLLLNIFGSMPPKENKPMKWSDIRKNARQESLSTCK